MQTALKDLPNDIKTLKKMVLNQINLRQEEAETRNALAAQTQQHLDAKKQLEKENQNYKIQVLSLQEQLNILLHKRFGASSEKLSKDQLKLFNEAEQETDALEQTALEDTKDNITVPEHQRKKPGRKPLPKSLPREEIIYDLTDDEKFCPDDGHALKAIGEERTEQLDYIPAQVKVIEHVRLKYACPCCAQGVKIAPLPPQPLPKSIASPNLLAHVTVSKYADGLPLYRQEKQWQRLGIELGRGTLSNWMVGVGILVQPLINLLREALLANGYIQMDETPLQVLNEPGKTPQSQSYMWVQRGGPPGQTIVLFEYDPTRSGSVPVRLLDGFEGYLQTDGYEGYGAVCRQDGITQLGCMAHARRKFDEAIKAQGKKKLNSNGNKATKGLNFIGKLYAIERAIKDSTLEERYQARQEQTKPIIEEMKNWLETSLEQVPPQSAIGKAIYYTHRQWPKLIRYLDDGQLHIDNNLIENAIRPFALGRKNWLFSNTQNGAKASAHLYSLVETAKDNGLEPYHYLRHVYRELPKAQTLEDIEALLPANIVKEKIIIS
ncbi:MAG: IS66 family transposase [Proteobacteria bacterium]|nr:IS66 family transposase [Pseudomonadota bacterium]